MAQHGHGWLRRIDEERIRIHLSDTSEHTIPATFEVNPDHALFAWLISRTFSANEQYFSLTTNQPTVFSVMAYQPSEQGLAVC